jgi:cation diffusion facilitator CzcD-associated flavoprotein CzcO
MTTTTTDDDQGRALTQSQGCGSDLPAHWYSLSRAPNPRWDTYYAGQRDIHAYCEAVWSRHGLRAHTRFGTEVVSATWDAHAQAYAVVLEDVASAAADPLEHERKRRRTVMARVVLSAVGGFRSPRVPEDLCGVETFCGESWHSAAWRHDVPLAGKRVGVIGNGCSA